MDQAIEENRQAIGRNRQLINRNEKSIRTVCHVIEGMLSDSAA